MGISVEKLGTKSIVYALAIFHEVESGHWEPAATGRFVHVYVDADTRKPVEIPAAIRSAAGTLDRKLAQAELICRQDGACNDSVDQRDGRAAVLGLVARIVEDASQHALRDDRELPQSEYVPVSDR